ncbi:MAG TPA: lipid A biosynthesis acyltransferase [Rariglobus sp.]|jgi:KDO2-lipid IV(A) lauroyltransferase|nr:lipid A biosynthesis acyltransferase [Rariglobus sp.]
MSHPSPSFARRIQWRLEYGAYVTVEKLIGLLTPREACLVGEEVGNLIRLFSARHRRIVERNLRIAFAGEKSPAELDALAEEVFRRAGANLIASLCTASLEPETLNRVIEVENGEMLVEAMAAGKGVIGILAHMGNWEALAQKFPQMMPPGAKAGDIYRRLSNPHLDARLIITRQRMGLKLFEKNVNPLALAAFLRAGSGLGIVSDQRAVGIGETVPFFGRLTACTPLPAVLTRRTGAPVFGISVTTRAPGKWRIKFHPFAGETTTENCMKVLEAVMRESPADVFWLQDRWKVNNHKPQWEPGRTPKDGIAVFGATKSRRCLVWLEADAGLVPPLKQAEPDNIVFEYSIPSDVPIPAWLPAGAILHVRPVLDRRRLLANEINRIDRITALPLDFVYAPHGPAKLVAVCRQMGMPVATVPEGNP